MKYGYARVSTSEQNLALQIQALKDAGCYKIYKEKVSGRGVNRPELTKVIELLKPGDTLVVWKLDRLSRSALFLIRIKNYFKKHNIRLQAVKESFDFHTAAGNFTYNVQAAVCEFERDSNKERTNAGLMVAKTKGIKSGRKPGLTAKGEELAAASARFYEEGKLSIMQICRKLKISKKTLYRYLRFHGVEPNRGFTGEIRQ